MTTLAVRADLTELSALTDGLEAFGADHTINAAIIAVVQLALAELVTGLSGATDEIQVALAMEEADLVVRVEARSPVPAGVPLDLVAPMCRGAHLPRCRMCPGARPPGAAGCSRRGPCRRGPRARVTLCLGAESAAAALL